MPDVPLEALRELARRNRRAHGWGAATGVAGLLAIPFHHLAATAWPQLLAWASLLAFALVGSVFLRAAFVMGQSRGAFRLLFRRLQEERRARRLVPDAPEPMAVVRLE